MIIKANQERLQNNLVRYSKVGKTKHGGVTRLSLSKADVEARKLLVSQFEALGLTVSLDDLGNMYGTLPGKNPQAQPIYVGSHMDTVRKGGRFDGILGVLAGLEAVTTIIEQEHQLEHPLCVVNFTNEEGARFEPAMMSSGILTSKFEKSDMLEVRDQDGISFEMALEESGFVGSEDNRLTNGHGYLELHIEQGPSLELKQKEIGLVQGVVGMICAEITIKGEADHAGTTPMGMRNDALMTALSVIRKLTTSLAELDEKLVYTVGRLEVEPNIHTVIPDLVVFTLESRHQDPEVIKKVKRIIAELDSRQNGCQLSQTILWERETVQFAPAIIHSYTDASQNLGYRSLELFSGAGHDAQYLASLMPAGMIFVPSVAGKSHCEEELTTYEDCAKGTNVLINAILSLDKLESGE